MSEERVGARAAAGADNRGPWPPVFVERSAWVRPVSTAFTDNRGPWPPVFVERALRCPRIVANSHITGGHGPRSSLSDPRFAGRVVRVGYNRGPWPPVFVERGRSLIRSGRRGDNRGPWPPVFVERQVLPRHLNNRVDNRGPWPPVFVERVSLATGTGPALRITGGHGPRSSLSAECLAPARGSACRITGGHGPRSSLSAEGGPGTSAATGR